STGGGRQVKRVGELAARALMEALYPGKKPSELNEEQKQYISTLATIAGGLAGGAWWGNTGRGMRCRGAAVGAGGGGE
ncbi:VENN motif pre-toxin domain-containing protein, partial [Dickeya ananatis]